MTPVKSETAPLPPPPASKSGWPWLSTWPTEVPRGDWPRFTIVTPSYNQGRFLEETIRSVLLQGYPNLDYIVIDGGSTDNSVEIIRKYARHLAYWVSEKDAGQADAINKGFRRGTGEWVGWLNSDDILLPGALYAVADAARVSKREWVAGAVQYMYDGKPELTSLKRQASSDKLIDWLVFSFYFHQPGAFWKRALFERVGFLRQDMHYSFDWAFWCNLVAAGVLPQLIDIPVAGFRHHDASKTCTSWGRFAAESERLIEEYLPQLKGADRQAAQRRRTELVCTQLSHEAGRYMEGGQRARILPGVWSAARRRPQILAHLTPYRIILQRCFGKSSAASR